MAFPISPAQMYADTLKGIRRFKTQSMTIDEWNQRANDMQLVYIKEKYAEYQRTQKRIHDINVQVNTFAMTSNPIDLSTTVPALVNLAASNGRYGHMFTTKVEVQLTYQNNPCFANGSLSEWITAIPFKDDKDLTNDYYWRPTDEKPYYKEATPALFGDKRLEIITNTASAVTNVRLHYIQWPLALVATDTNVAGCDLPLHARKELVDLIVKDFLEITKDQRYQTILQEKVLGNN